MTSTRRADAAFAAGRRDKAVQFLAAADAVMDFVADVGDAYVTLSVHAGIAAADAVCARRLGVHAAGDSHAEAVALLRRVAPTATASPGTSPPCSG